MTQEQPAPRRLGRPGRVGLLLAVLLLLAGAAGVWAFSLRVAGERAARGAFPLVAGQLRVEGLAARVQIDRDARGIPHVLADAEADAWFGLGFAHAQDRLAQMLWLRRIALGRAAERIGESGLASDRLARTLGFARLAEAATDDLDPRVASMLGAYAAGVNARIARVQSGRVAAPFVLQPASPLLELPGAAQEEEVRAPLDADPWTPVHSLAIGKLVAWSAGASHDRAIVLSDLIERLGSMGARPFFPGGEQELGLAVPLDDPGGPDASPADEVPAVDLLSLASLRGSAWALSGANTASGAPFVVAELAVGPTAPSLLYEAHVRGGELDTAGVTVPGLPIFWAGRNPELSWAAVPIPVATVDLFKESVKRGPDRPADASGSSGEERPTLLYQNGSRWVQVDERYEEIRVAPPADDEEPRVERLRVRETRHGPLVNPVLRDGRSRAPLALAWTGARPGDPLVGLLRLAHARDQEAARAALALHAAPPVEVVYADRNGAVGLQVAGWLPQRTLPSGLSPVPGRLRAFDWRSPVEAEALPHLELGTEGAGDAILVSSGTTLEEEISGLHFEWLWRSDARARRVGQLVSKATQAAPIELRAAAEVQRDVSANVDPQLVAALLRLAGKRPELSPEGEEVAALLRRWDGQAGTASGGAVAFQLLVGHLLEELLEPAIGRELMDRYLAIPGVDPTSLVESIVVGALRAGRRGSWTDPEAVSRAVREGLRRTWVSLSYRLGHNRERWTWGRLHAVDFTAFTPGTVPRLAEAPRLGPFPMAGQRDSVARSVPELEGFAATRASTFRMAADLASPDRMLTTLAPGQSEHPGHVHYDDGVEAWREGRSSLVVTSRFLLEEAAVERLVLEP